LAGSTNLNRTVSALKGYNQENRRWKQAEENEKAAGTLLPGRFAVFGFGVGRSVCHIRQQGDLAGALDCFGQLALMHCAGTRRSAGQNFGTLRKITPQFAVSLYLYAPFYPRKRRILFALAVARTSFHGHKLTSLY
jgi:hypothetical protein